MSRKIFIIFILLFSKTKCYCYHPDSFYQLPGVDRSKSFLFIGYDNDFFSATDYYYSQGIHLEWADVRLNKMSPAILLVKGLKNKTISGISLHHIVYTPSSIRHTEILYGDRPFAACLIAENFSVSSDTNNHCRISSILDLGIIGDWVGGEWMQKTIHKNLHNIEPLGWENQVSNDAIINYEISFEKLLLGYGNHFCLSYSSSAALGTLHDKVSAGTCIMIGYFNNPFVSLTKKKSKCHANFTFKPSLSFVGYDATLQGGVFNHSSPYTLSSKEITRITFEGEGGISITFKKIYLEYYQHVITKEFRTGKYHQWGGLRMCISI